MSKNNHNQKIQEPLIQYVNLLGVVGVKILSDTMLRPIKDKVDKHRKLTLKGLMRCGRSKYRLIVFIE